MDLYQSLSDSPVWNSELEKYFLTAHPPKDVLLLYINRPSVIVGRNQAVEAEVNTAYCQEHGIEILKRISGGGTVYHDCGNINYAFVVSKGSGSVLDMDFATPILAALDSLGVVARVGKRKELLVGDYKISGTASHVSGDRVLFHGTLLHASNLHHLAFTLQGDRSLRGKKVASIPSSVMNLNVLTGLKEPTSDFLKKLLAFWSSYYQTDVVRISDKEESGFTAVSSLTDFPT